MLCIKNKLTTALLSFCFINVASPAFSQGTTTKNPELPKLFASSGGTQAVKKFEKQLLAEYSKKLTTTYEKIPDAFWDDFFNIMTPDGEIESLFESTYGIYEQYFTPDEIKLLNRYLTVPVLQKWIELSPKINQEQALLLEESSKGLLEDPAFNGKLEKLGEKYIFDKARQTISKKEQKKSNPQTK
ncbi:MAG: hypothetical protein COW89_03295 [Nitrospinae bacterium CG22_combo_CG10-13_8_21_14_all_47_10]|nr:MAG: hypothetical protein COW89_03295 [Nitrospinae bacterium CG22_combo_CG10-13_8_21_14_all_47_10]